MMGVDKQDGRLVAKGVVILTIAGSLVIGAAGVVGLAWRVFTMAAGG